MACPICYADEQTQPHALPCGHSFCAGCIISWFRSGHDECPVCRGTSTVTQCHIDARYRARAIIARARTKSASTQLKRRVEGVRKADAAEREAKRNMRLFKQEHADAVKEYTTLRNKVFRTHRIAYMRRQQLGFAVLPKDEPLIAPNTFTCRCSR